MPTTTKKKNMVFFSHHAPIQNMISMIVTIIYARLVLTIATFLVNHQWIGVKLSRKMIHVLAGTWLLFWPLFEPLHWTWVLAMAVPFLYVWILLFKGLTTKDRNDNDVKTMSRSGDPKELLAGPLYYLMVMCIIGYSLFMTRIGVLSLSILSWGDGLAPYFGEKYGKRGYQTFGRRKTYVGSLAMFIAAFIGGLLVSTIMFSLPDAHLLMAHLIACALATVAEAFSPADIDNFIIPIVAFMTFWCLGIYY
jgi:phytol kinase